jgi:hypothetical protein
MNRLELKRELVEECKTQQQKVVSNLKMVMSEAQQSANEYGPPKDRYDSFRMQQLRKKDMYGQQLEKALSELYALEKIDLKKEMNVTGFGSVVFTKDLKIFISIGLGKLQLGKEDFLAVSIMVPLAKAVTGKQKGDKTEFNGKIIDIIDVF